MNETEFFYWLQGFFEIAEAGSASVVALTQEQARVVVRHAHLVETCAGRKLFPNTPVPPDGSLSERFDAIAGLASMIVLSPATSSDATPEIKRILSEQFQHVIDPKAGDAEQQAKLNDIHSPGGRWPHGPRMRC